MIQQITTTKLAQRLAENDDSFFLLDVREPHETAIAIITPHCVVIPMGSIPSSLSLLPMDKDIIIYCHHGVRSHRVADYLVSMGFDAKRVYNLAGGIEAWALEIDPSLARY